MVTVGSLHAGTTFNVIPDRAQMQGTVRAFDEQRSRRRSPTESSASIAGVCSATRLEYRFDYHFVYPATMNDLGVNAVVREVAREVVGGR